MKHTHTYTHTHTVPRSSRGECFAQHLFRKAILAGLVKIGGTSGPTVGTGLDLQEGGQSSGDPTPPAVEELPPPLHVP